MKYEKGEFTLVPNKTARKGLKPSLQVAFMWLCEHSDKDYKSHPSRTLLASECGMSVKQLDRALKELEELGFITKQNRIKNNEKKTNEYTILLFAEVGTKTTLGRDKNDPRVGTKTTYRTQPIKLNPLKTITNVIEKPTVYGKSELNDLFTKWENIVGYSITSNKQKNRYAANNLLKKYTLQELERLLMGVAQSQQDQYAPRIANFIQLQAKLDDLLAWGRRTATATDTSKKGLRL